MTTGLYRVVRNHAVRDFLLVLGLNVTLLTVIMLVCGLFGVLSWRLSKREDKDLEEQFGQEFVDCKNRV